MSKTKLVVAAGAFALLLPAVTAAADRADRRAASISPGAFPALTNIYVASGVRDNGGAINTGTATSIHCTNWTGANQQIRHIIKNYNGAVTSNNTFTVSAGRTHTASTHGTVAYNEDAFLSTGTVIEQGSLVIAATASQITCTVVSIDAAAAATVGVPLHVLRFNPWPGSQE